MFINDAKKIELNDNEVVITVDIKNFEDDEEFIKDVVRATNENTILSDNILELLSKNLNKIKYTSDLIKSIAILLKNNKKVELSNELLNYLFSNAYTFRDLIFIYDIFNQYNLLDSQKEKAIINKLAKEIPYTYRIDDIKNTENELRELLNNYLNSHKDLLIKALKIFINEIFKSVLSSFKVWLINPRRYQFVSYFFMLYRALKDYNLDYLFRDEDILKDKIEILKTNLLAYENKVKKIIKNRIKNENYKNEMITIIELLGDKTLYKYLL